MKNWLRRLFRRKQSQISPLIIAQLTGEVDEDCYERFMPHLSECAKLMGLAGATALVLVCNPDNTLDVTLLRSR